MAFRLAAIARSFDMDHLAVFPGSVATAPRGLVNV
jgi:hypothetical protein